MKNTLIINLFGSPGSGKSTGATYIFSKLKMFGIDCQYIGEYAKDKCWQGNSFMFQCPQNQFYIGAKQFYRVNQVNGKVDVAITDSPILLNSIYNKSEYLGQQYNHILYKLFNKFDNLNFFLKRTKQYNANGRNQTEIQSDEISSKIVEMMFNNGVECTFVDGDEDGYQKIYDFIIKKLNK